MSKFIDALKRTAAPSISSIGFQTKTSVKKNPQLLVVASIVSDSKKALKVIGAAGMDALLIRSQSQFSLNEIHKAAGDVPVGLHLNGADIESELPNSIDFIVYTMKMPLSFLNKTAVGKIMEIEPSLDLGSIRAINGLGSIIDAVMIGGDNGSLTIERLLSCQRLSDLIVQPVVVSVDSTVKSSELVNLCEAGVDGIIITDVCTASAYGEIRKAVNELPANSKRKSSNAAIVPKLNEKPASDDGDDQGEDE